MQDTRSTERNISWLIQAPIAHRGLHDIRRQIPENSIPAFMDAVDHGFPIELDIRRTLDNQIVVCHDSNLLRLTGSNQHIEALPLQSIKDLRLRNTEFRIPLFEDILKAVDEKVPILIDIKNEKTAGVFENKIYEIIGNYSGKFAVESFNPLTLQWFKNNAPGILRGRVGYDHNAESFKFLRRYLIGRFLKDPVGSPDFLACDIRCRPYWAVQFHRRKGVVILGWTAKNKKQMTACGKYFDNLMFEGFLPENI
ncbi:MAG TPA: glycerophosphodiester phosphodiesterase [Deltaproteobacteria bacterium]|nr:glycerophosphodiester phosphodiesterase [Deltaproteobacteria bacterium]